VKNKTVGVGDGIERHTPSLMQEIFSEEPPATRHTAKHSAKAGRGQIGVPAAAFCPAVAAADPYLARRLHPIDHILDDLLFQVRVKVIQHPDRENNVEAPLRKLSSNRGISGDPLAYV